MFEYYAVYHAAGVLQLAACGATKSSLTELQGR